MLAVDLAQTDAETRPLFRQLVSNRKSLIRALPLTRQSMPYNGNGIGVEVGFIFDYELQGAGATSGAQCSQRYDGTGSKNHK